MDKHLNIKEWDEDDRPREKLLAQGSGVLTDAELLAILLRSGNNGETAVELAKRILHSVNHNLYELGKVDISFLTKHFKGVGQTKAVTILAALELGRRRSLSEPSHTVEITTSRHIFQHIAPRLADLSQEEFWVLLLNRANKIIDQRRLTIGGTGRTIVEIPSILKIAIEKPAAKIVVCHNHPSGNYQPSQNDITLTNKLNNACKLLEITFIDHVIVAGSSYYSFADAGLL